MSGHSIGESGADESVRPAASSGPIATLALAEFVATFEAYFGYGAGEVAASARLREDLGFDSLEMIEVILLLDSVADALVPMDLVESIVTVADIHQWMTVYAGRTGA